MINGNKAANLVVVDIRDVVDGKCVTKGCSLGDLGEPGHQLQLWGAGRNWKGVEQEKGSNRDWIEKLTR